MANIDSKKTVIVNVRKVLLSEIQAIQRRIIDEGIRYVSHGAVVRYSVSFVADLIQLDLFDKVQQMIKKAKKTKKADHKQ